jgi:hypothetical protein
MGKGVIMTPHEALEKIGKTILHTYEPNGNITSYQLRDTDEYKLVANRLQELELVNERLEKEIREVLKK